MAKLLKFAILLIIELKTGRCIKTAILISKLSGSKITILKKTVIIFIVLLFFLHPKIFLVAQSSDERPRIGLVLSGGGSHGIAHIGVLKVMEEAGLRPDFITGVSMGSIVGGMYSIGYKADSLQKILKNINWDLSLSNNIPEYKVVFPEKEHFNNSIMSLSISARKIKLPSGLISGQQIENLLSFYAWPAADINDFSKLPIPFMCLGTDILTGKKVELKNGYLPDALRASIAVPTIFTPIKIDTILLIDGGVISNFAVSEVKNMGADIVVGSYVGFHNYSEEELQSLSGIIKQVGFLRSLDDYNNQKKNVDVLIEPKLKGFSSAVFSNIDTLIQRGYIAALPYKDYFSKLPDSLNLIAHQRPVENILDKQFYTFDKIEISGNEINSDAQILGVLDIEPGEKVDKYRISEKIELLYGRTWFEKIKYRVVPKNDSLILAIDCIELPKAMLYGSVHYDNSIRSGVVFRMTIKNLITARSLVDFDSYLGQFFRFKFSYLQFIDRNEKLGLSASFYTDNTLIPVIKTRGETGGLFSRNYQTGLTFGKVIGLNQMMSITANIGKESLIPDYVSDNHLRKLTYNYSSATYDYQINSLDKKHFPDKGTILQISLGTTKLIYGIVKTDTSKVVYKQNNPEHFSFKRFFSFAGNIKHYFSLNNKISLALIGNALFIPGYKPDFPAGNYYLLGGLESLNRRSIPMIGFHSNEIAVSKLALIGSDVDFEIFENIHINILANIAASHETGSGKDLSLLAGYGLSIGYMSIIGPLKIGLMHGISIEERYFNRIKGFISIGYRF